MEKERTLVIYHAGCRDGFGAAWVVKNSGSVNNPEFFPASYGKEPPDVTGRDVIMVDFSYKREVLLDMIEKCKSMIVLDHHKTAQADLADLTVPPDKYIQIVFDMKRSGIGLAWDYFEIKERPWIVDYVEDRDLWNWKLPRSREINSYLQVTPYDFGAWDEVMDDGKGVAYDFGETLIKAQNDRNGMVLDMGMQIIPWFWGYSNVPVVNAPTEGISELMELMLQRTQAPFVVGWRVRRDGVLSISLRSTAGEDSFDVSALASQMGGGGHRNAAGFEVHAYERRIFLENLEGSKA